MQSRRDRVLSEATGEAILAAWRDGRLTGSPGHSGDAHVELLGVGESYAAWHLARTGGAELTVRVATREPADMPRPIAQEAAALPYVPTGSGPRLVATGFDDGPTNPLRSPYLVLTHQPGRVLAPRDWQPAHRRAHAVGLARLHRDRYGGRGEFGLAGDPLAGLVPGPMSLLAVFDAMTDWWREHHPGVWADTSLAEIVPAARAVCAAAEPVFGELDAYTVVHGEPVATNVLWEPGDADRCHYIDFEWAQVDDPARDLAIAGGPVHVGPWYLPLDEAGVDTLLDDYLAEAARLGHRLDRTALRRRRDAWEAYERTSMLLYLTRRAREGRRGFPDLARALAHRLAATLRTRPQRRV